MTKRIQLSRKRGWRKPEGAVTVSRSTRWGNPFKVSDVAKRFPSLTIEQCKITVYKDFCVWANSPNQAEYRRQVQQHLEGRDLACWCTSGDFCHGDVLLEIANREED